jgi:peptide deformylase
MALLSVLEYPDKRLRNKALPVVTVDTSVRAIVNNMFETMYAETGVGLASTQVNVLQRIIVIDISDDKKSPITAINPEIIQRVGKQYEFEGCLSFPGAFDKVERAEKIVMRALNQDGESYELAAEGLLAICIQHELDHLDGILFIDHLSRLKRERFNKKLEKMRNRAVS